MMNYIWSGMLLIGIIYGCFTGHLQSITDAVIQSSKEAITLGITMLGIVSFWSGLMEVAVEAGIMERLTRRMKPILRFLFPNIPSNHSSLKSIAANFVANILGLGWAATPMGLDAMKQLVMLEEERGNDGYLKSYKETDIKEREASDEMCVFLTMNISSLQLIPVNVIAYRSQYGSVNPAAIIAPGIAATLASTVVAVIYCKWRTKIKKYG